MMFLTTIVFVLSFVLGFVCHEVHRPSALANILNRAVSKETWTSMGIVDVESSLISCLNGSSFANVIPAIGRELDKSKVQIEGLRVKMLENLVDKFNESVNSAVGNLNSNPIGQKLQTAIDETIKTKNEIDKIKASGSEAFREKIASLLATLTSLQGNLTSLKTGELTDANLKETYRNLFEPMRKNITKQATESFTRLQNQIQANVTELVPTCEPFVTVLGNVEVTLCQEVGSPMAGIWLGNGLLLCLSLFLLAFQLVLLKFFSPYRRRRKVKPERNGPSDGMSMYAFK